MVPAYACHQHLFLASLLRSARAPSHAACKEPGLPYCLPIYSSRTPQLSILHCFLGRSRRSVGSCSIICKSAKHDSERSAITWGMRGNTRPDTSAGTGCAYPNNLQTLNNVAKHNVPAVQPWGFLAANEELTAIRVRACVRHTNYALADMLKSECFVVERWAEDTVPSGAITSCDISPLNHEVAVEARARLTQGARSQSGLP
eukprot:scaffold21_cov368-Prasinococcus_capsulatus_cf.AAC.9